MSDETQRHMSRGGVVLAYRLENRHGDGPALVWLGGYKSDMTGSKAECLSGLAARLNCPYLRFDYSGHGASGGEFEDGTVSLWLAESLEMIETFLSGPVVLAGSSMGGFIALHAAAALKDRLKGLILLAPAADMTEALIWAHMTPDERAILARDGRLERPSIYSPEPYVFTARLIEDGRRLNLLAAGIDLAAPVRILQGEADPDVPWQHGLATYRAIRGSDVSFTLIKDGDHRLSKPHELALLEDTARSLILTGRP